MTDTGFAPSTVAATASDTAPIGNGHNTFLVYTNNHTAAQTVTVAVPGNTFFGAANPDNAISVPNGATRYIPLRKEYDDGTGNATITITAPTSIVVSVVRIG
jgi:hypothetical protein